MSDLADQLFATIERIEVEFKMCKSIVMTRDKCMQFYYPRERECDKLFCCPSKQWLAQRDPYRYHTKVIMLTDYGHVAML